MFELLLVALCVGTFLLGRAVGWWAVASGLIVGLVIFGLADDLEGDLEAELGFVFGASTLLTAAVGALVRQRGRVR